MENRYQERLELRWRTMIHGAEQKQRRENQSLWSWCVEAKDWGYIWRERIGDATVKGEDWRLFLIFSKKYWRNHDLQSRDIEIATGNCLSWNVKICWFKNEIPQISPNQSYPDFCNLINGCLALSKRLNKRALIDGLDFSFILD